MSFFNWLFRTQQGREDWRELTEADVKQAEESSKFWQNQKNLAIKYVKAKGTAYENQALSKAAFKLLPVAMQRAQAIDRESSAMARLEGKQAQIDANKRLANYARQLRERTQQ